MPSTVVVQASSNSETVSFHAEALLVKGGDRCNHNEWSIFARAQVDVTAEISAL